MPTNFIPGTVRELLLVATNVGSAPTAGAPIELEATLPPGLKPELSTSGINSDPDSSVPVCTISGQVVKCETAAPLHPSRWLGARVPVGVGALPPQMLSASASVEGGGASTVATSASIQISPEAPGFDFAGSMGALLSAFDGSTTTAAGSHPEQFTLNFGFTSEQVEGATLPRPVGHPHDIVTEIPRGLVVNPTATPTLCTEALLETSGEPGCPDDSQVGIVNITTVTGGVKVTSDKLYNMVPPPGEAATLGFNADGVGIFLHVTGSVRSDGDYGITAIVKDVLAFPNNPVMVGQGQIWGDPTGESHDQIRGACEEAGEASGPCPSPETQETAAITMPSQCTGPITFTVKANSWEEPGKFHERSAQSTDTGGTPVGVNGCNALEFEPKIEAKPTTNLTDSPAGLEFDLHQPQETKLGGLSTANLKDATVTFPEGLVVNPAAAAGQGVCTDQQVGLTTGVGESPIHFSKDPASCPDAAKIGNLEASTPLLGRFEEGTGKVLYDAEGNAVRRPLQGSVYLAKPFQNPFGSLIAIYLVMEDHKSGTVAKFAAKIDPDSGTGRLTNTLTEGPELPIEDVRIETFKGPLAPLRTPPTCATYTTTSDLVPWSSPEGLHAHPTDSFAITANPGGGPCPTDPASAPNKPSFVAGTISPQAGAYSPFVMKVTREDASQPIAGFEATLPQGLLAKLAGVPYCPEAAIAQAQGRSNPEEGRLEQQSPSCPAASEVGSVDAAAGAGPTPLHTTGHVYLAGPYKGAPLSFVIVTPAVAGPFDLGVVVVRTALYIDPERAQGRAVSDPFPTILDGIPLDLRSAAVKIDRPDFTLNPTNCEPKAVLATTTSVFGQPAALSSPFAVGGCKGLAFKPKLSIKLKGQPKRTGHPALTGTVKLTPGQANVKRMAVTLPRSEFLDQNHIGTVCTRVQFAAKQCPAASIYGFATATTPLLSDPLEGPVYLRSSSHELPDVVIALHGQVDVVLDGRVDSVNGGIRTTFENVPDAPATKFVLKLRGASKGLLINSANLCKLTPDQTRATVKADGQNGKLHDFNPVVKSDCATKPAKKHKRGAHR